MIRSLAKNVPAPVLTAVNKALADRERIESRRADALQAYHAQMRLNYMQIEPLDDKLASNRADALFEWGMMLRERLPIDELRRGFKSGEVSSLALVSHEIDLKPETGAAGGRLKVRLDLELEDPAYLFRHYAWFEGCRVVGGAALNSALALQMSLHAEMLRQIHNRIAEGDVWDRVIHDLKRIHAILTDS
ncbi:MAG: hypothetical protein QY323_04765 [Patescibacteria group bacterium]|nr:MAG: hypothetical protein QY323_04765 [Patescibacteria group bacterium]